MAATENTNALQNITVNGGNGEHKQELSRISNKQKSSKKELGEGIREVRKQREINNQKKRE